MSTFEAQAAENLIAVGATKAHTVRIWLRTSKPGPHVLRVWTLADRTPRGEGRFFVDDNPVFDGTTSVEWPTDFDRASPLRAHTAYGFSISRGDGAAVGEGRFETAPEDPSNYPERFSIAILSCHQPFDKAGRLRSESDRQLRVLESAFEQHAVKRVLLLGDQMYSDLPETLSLFNEDYFRKIAPPTRTSLFDCSRAEVRRLYQERYRIFWSHPAWQRILSRFACSMIMDDHELYDNFGSAKEHATPRWAAVREGALDAFYDYQGLLPRARAGTRPESLHFYFEYGPVAVFVMDIRSQRRMDDHHIRVYNERQFQDLSAYLRSQSQRPIFVLGIGVPLVHLPRWAADAAARFAHEGKDVHDRWGYEKTRLYRNQLIDLLHEHQKSNPHQRLILASGDIHTGVLSELIWSKPELRALQIISSAVSNLEGVVLHKVAQAVALLGAAFDVSDEDTHCDVRLFGGKPNHNPYAGLNAGIIEVSGAGSARPRIRLKLIGHDSEDPPKPKVICETEEL
jgi:phosphodiesterase/alkaline phosphatase D-like protein